MKVLPVAIYQARATELPTHAPAVLVAADGLGVNGFLSTLVTCGTPHAIVDFVRASFHGVNGSAIVGNRAVHFNGMFVFIRHDSSSPVNEA